MRHNRRFGETALGKTLQRRLRCNVRTGQEARTVESQVQDQRAAQILREWKNDWRIVQMDRRGSMPYINLGTAGGTSAAPDLIEDLVAAANAAAPYTTVLDGRFKGGYITRAYGRPAEGVHAVQLELAQIAYMDEDPPFAWRPEKAARLQPVLKALLQAMLDWAQVQPDSRP